MKDQERQRQAPVCPSCGQPVKIGFKINDKIKMLLVILSLSYVVLSTILTGMSSPPEMRRGCGAYDWRWQVPYITPDPNRCKDTEFTSWMKQINKTPAFQIFVGGGLATGVFILYWDWFQEVYQNWQKKRKKLSQESRKRYKYKCHNCGKQWN
jgi:hypothetical protein